MQPRAKDLIHRGGETFDPAAVDAILLSHPAIQDAAACAMEHGTLAEQQDESRRRQGPTLACAIVLRPGQQLHRAALRVFAGRFLPAAQVPHQIYFVSEIPRSPTGRPQRMRLTRQLAELRASGVAGAQPYSAVEDLPEVEADLLERWRVALHRPALHPDEDFFTAGGDAATAQAMLLEVKAAYGLRYRLLFDGFAYEPTVFHLAEMIRYGQEMGAPSPQTHRMRIVPVRERSSPSPERPLLYLLPPDGDEGTCFRVLSDALGPEWPVSVVRPAGLLHQPGPYQIEEAARECADLIAADSAGSPFALGGFCYGGVLAAEIARLLEDRGCSALVLFDTPMPGHPHYLSKLRFAGDNLRWVRALLAARHESGWSAKYGKTVIKRTAWHAIRASRPILSSVWRTPAFQAIARRASAADMPFFFKLKPLRLPILHLLSAGHTDLLWRQAVLDWHQVAPGRVTITRLTGAHLRLFYGANLLQMVAALESWFGAAPSVGEKDGAQRLPGAPQDIALEQGATLAG